MKDLKTMCSEVQNVARETGQFIFNEQKKLDNKNIETKSGNSDLVTNIDKESEEQIVKKLREIFPEAGFITEEEITRDEEKEYNWIIDPLDGTTNFVHGLPPYAVSIALAKGTEMQLGVVYEIPADKNYYAWKGGGAYCQDEKISVTSTDSLSNALITTGFPYSGYENVKMMMNTLEYLIQNSHGMRRLGSAAVDLAYLASGKIDIFYEVGLHVWDVAAASLIVKEAGGHVSDFSGGTDYLYGGELAATNKNLNNNFLNILQKFFRES